MNNLNPINKKSILVTGNAGFIGFHLTKALLEKGVNVIGIDNLNDYYDPILKEARLSELDTFYSNIAFPTSHYEHSEALIEKPTYQFIKMNLADRGEMQQLFNDYQFDVVVNLAAQAGVRYSIDNPHAYVDSNLVGFVNVLEGCRYGAVKHLVYASSSSVYGMNVKQPFSTDDCVDFPISLYAATKRSNELMAYTYSHLFNLPTTGLRFFTVYGPWGRPDMAYYKFTKAILEGKPIDVYNYGQMQRDFTYIDDIIDGILRVIVKPPALINKQDSHPNEHTDNSANQNKITNAKAPYKLYNIGNNQPVTLRRFIAAIENACGRKAIQNSLPMQPGDVPVTYAEINEISADLKYKPKIKINNGIKTFVNWYIDYSNNS